MGLKTRFFGVIRYMMFERTANKMTLNELADDLAKGGAEITERASKASESDRNRNQLIHITGIERWGQRRLSVGLGETLIHDEYDGYSPPTTASWDELRTAFDQTRNETISIARKLAKANITPERTVHHNAFGDMSLHGWLRYLHFHANQESKSIK